MSSWVCTKCGSSKIYWDKEKENLVCKDCRKIFDDELPRTVVLSSDRITERGTCQVCGLENAHLIAKCKSCGRKVCAEECLEMLDADGLCCLCQKPIVPF